MRRHFMYGVLICCLVPLLGQAQSSANYTITGGDLNSDGNC